MSNNLTPFGQRITMIRKSIGIPQTGVPGINQPRLSKIENGKEDASVAIIERLATVLRRDPLDLVKGTDREGYYVSQRLKPEERQELQRTERLKNAAALEYVYLYYMRVCDLFDALYGGSIVPAFQAEDAYIELRSHCQKAIAAVERFIPEFGQEIYFLDHIEPDNEDDDMLMCSDYFAGELKKSLRHIQRAMHDYNDCYDGDSRNALVKYWGLDRLDEIIAKLREARVESERRFWRRAEQIRKQFEAKPGAELT